MNVFEKLITKYNTQTFDFLKKEAVYLVDLKRENDDFLNSIWQQVERYKKYGEYPAFVKGTATLAEEGDPKNKKNPSTLSNNRDSIKENVIPEGVEEEAAPRTRTKRKGVKDVSQVLNQQTTNVGLVPIKKEKISLLPDVVPGAAVPAVTVKTEAEEMPAPSKRAPRKKAKESSSEVPAVAPTTKRVTRSKLKKEKVDVERESDVILQPAPVTTVEVSDDDQSSMDSTRSARTKTRGKKQEKRPRSGKTNSETSVSDKRPKSGDKYDSAQPTFSATSTKSPENKPEDPPVSAGMAGEKKLCNLTVVLDRMDTTVVVQKPLDATMVVENPKYPQAVHNNHQNIDDLMTDDESIEEARVPTKKPLMLKEVSTKTATKSKPVFSPFDSSPVKKRVEAFEKLGSQAGTPARPNRIPVKDGKTQDEHNAANESRNQANQRPKAFTPVAQNKFGPRHCSTSKVPKYLPSMSVTANESSASKHHSTTKSIEDFREREKRRKEKEEVLRQREAMKLAQMEEKRKRNEEKQLKAQQQREALEKEKQKALEAQKLKEERHKQLLLEQEEKKQKLREEMEKKRKEAKQRALEKLEEEKLRLKKEKHALEKKKKKEEEKQQQQQEQAEQKHKSDSEAPSTSSKLDKDQSRKPRYMIEKTPQLDLADRFDSDDEEYNPSAIKFPSWASEGELQKAQRAMLGAGDKMKNTFFALQPQTADLQEIFVLIDHRKLRRNSSARWAVAPRYTLMPNFDHINEVDTDDEEEDDES